VSSVIILSLKPLNLSWQSPQSPRSNPVSEIITLTSKIVKRLSIRSGKRECGIIAYFPWKQCRHFTAEIVKLLSYSPSLDDWMTAKCGIIA